MRPAIVGQASGVVAIVTLKRRAEFQRVRGGARYSAPAFLLECKARPEGQNFGQDPRFGFTITKKIGNAVVRNRMKRRFRALLRELLPQAGLSGHDHVLIGREGGIERDFAKLREELSAALARAAEGKGDPPRRKPGTRR